MAIATTQDLVKYCNWIVRYSKTHATKAYPYFYSLNNTGARPVEILKRSFCIEVNENRLLCQPDKRNNKREILIESFHPFMVSYYIHLHTNIHTYNYRNFLRSFHKTPYGASFFINNDRIGLHVFRYMYAKLKYEQFQNYQTLADHMGWTSPDMAIRYVNTDIQMIV